MYSPCLNYCLGNCKKANRCSPLDWSSWTPAVANGQCKDQTRYQDKKAEYIYQMKQDNCHGINPNCNPSRINDKRTFCKLPFLNAPLIFI